MIKRSIFYTFLFALVLMGIYNVYNNYKAEVVDPSPISTINFDLSEAKSVNEINLIIVEASADETINILFYDHDDINSQYMFNVTLTSILNNHQLTKFENLYFVDICDVPTDSKLLMKSRYGFSSVPAFVNLQYGENTITINDSIQEDASSLLTETKVENWLIQQGIIEKIQTQD